MRPFRVSSPLFWLGLMGLSLPISLWHFGPLAGTLPALVLTVVVQVYGLGYVAARTLDLWRRPQPVVIRIVSMAACGLGITIIAGAVCRLLLVPLSAYVIGLHLLMGVLVCIPVRSSPATRIAPRYRFAYWLLAGLCLLFIGVGWSRNQYRMGDYPDQSYPVSLADWWVTHPQPELIVSRNSAELNTTAYWSTDGLTYVFAAWAWSSGASAVQVIWYGMTPLFVGLVPLLHFVVAYRVTRRQDTAAWAAGVSAVFALTTLNAPSLLGGAWMYGQEAAFHLTTLRYVSTALLLPAVLFVFFTCLRIPRGPHYLMLGVMVLALALTHPRQLLVALTLMYAVLGLRWLMQPNKRRLRQSVLIVVATLPALGIPLWQYSEHLQNQITPDIVSELAGASSISQSVIEPSMLLFHPFVVLALVLTLTAVIRLRRSLAAQYAVAAALVLLVLSYVPPVFNLILRLLGSYYGLHYIFELFYILPVGLVLGIAIGAASDWVRARLRLPQAGVQGAVAVLFAGSILVGLVEPVPLPQSPHDQLRALDQLQAIRDIQPFDEHLLARLAALPVTANQVAYVSPNRIANYIIESVPNAFVTGGRKPDNPSYAGNTRFFDEQHTPWLDAADIAFLRQYDVRYLVLPGDNTRIPQLALQPERFTWIDTVAGYAIFSVRQPLVPTPTDQLFEQMNVMLDTHKLRLWDSEHGFTTAALVPQVDWAVLAGAWQQQPESDLTRYGTAFARLLVGDMDLAVWQALADAHPELSQINEVYAQALMWQNHPQASVSRLLDNVTADTGPASVLTARKLLSPAYFGWLTAEQQQQVLAAVAADSDTWANLAEWTHEAGLRQRAAVLMSAGYWHETAAWLSRIPEVKRAPSDLVALAAIRLVLGDTAGAERVLQPALNADWVEPHRSIYENDWSPAGNTAARMYAALTEPASAEVSPALVSETGSLFIMQADVRPQGSQLMLAATLGSFTPALPPQLLTIRVVSADGSTTYVAVDQSVEIAAGTAQRLLIPLDIPTGAPPQAPVRVIITLRHNEQFAYQTREVQAVLP